MGLPAFGEADVPEILRSLGVAPPRSAIGVRRLPGGVSSDVWLATCGPQRWIVKRPLERFRTAADWRVGLRRVRVEHAFIRALTPLLPSGSLAAAAAFAPAVPALVLEAAPASWSSWKERLLAGHVEAEVARSAGKLLAAVHAAGESPALRGRFENTRLFEQQRLEPYFRRSAHARPHLAAALADVEGRLLERGDLVHGDFSPKNLLTDGSRVQLIDHEVATRADAAFDVAFLLSHLVLKAIHRPPAAPLAATADSFLTSYGPVLEDPGRPARAWGYVGALLVARTLGASPADYLGPAARNEALALGERWLRRPPRGAADAFAQAEGASAV